MQGPVYGVETEESKIDDRLKTIFNYDEIFGPIVNRFVTQAVVGSHSSCMAVEVRPAVT